MLCFENAANEATLRSTMLPFFQRTMWSGHTALFHVSDCLFMHIWKQLNTFLCMWGTSSDTFSSHQMCQNSWIDVNICYEVQHSLCTLTRWIASGRQRCLFTWVNKQAENISENNLSFSTFSSLDSFSLTQTYICTCTHKPLTQSRRTIIYL